MFCVAVCFIYTILFGLEKRLQENRQREFSCKPARKIFYLVGYVSNLVNWIDRLATTQLISTYYWQQVKEEINKL